MRSSSVRSSGALAAVHACAVMRAAAVRCALSVSILSFMLCAPPPKPAQAPEPSVTLEGDVALAGEDPIDRTLVLSDEGGSVCTLVSPRFEYELRSLAGHRVRVTGRVVGKTDGVPEFLVESYEMAPIDGRAPVIGILVQRIPGLVLLEWRSSVVYALSGPLVNALREFCNFKVWIDGTVAPSEENGLGGTIAVEGYGVLAPIALIEYKSPPDSLRGPAAPPRRPRP